MLLSFETNALQLTWKIPPPPRRRSHPLDHFQERSEVSIPRQSSPSRRSLRGICMFHFLLPPALEHYLLLTPENATSSQRASFSFPQIPQKSFLVLTNCLPKQADQKPGTKPPQPQLLQLLEDACRINVETSFNFRTGNRHRGSWWWRVPCYPVCLLWNSQTRGSRYTGISVSCPWSGFSLCKTVSVLWGAPVAGDVYRRHCRMTRGEER